jgi:DNA-binding transcriptional ArsR family regulator
VRNREKPPAQRPRRGLFCSRRPPAQELAHAAQSYRLPRAQAARLFHALGGETRLGLVLLLARRGKAGVGDLRAALRLTQPAVSYPLRLLHRAGLVEGRREGSRALYRLSSPAAAAVLRLVCGP